MRRWLRTDDREGRGRRAAAPAPSTSCPPRGARTASGTARATGGSVASISRPDVTRSRRCSGDRSGRSELGAQPDDDALHHVPAARDRGQEGGLSTTTRRSSRWTTWMRAATSGSSRRSRWNHTNRCGGVGVVVAHRAAVLVDEALPRQHRRHVHVLRQPVSQPGAHRRPLVRTGRSRSGVRSQAALSPCRAGNGDLGGTRRCYGARTAGTACQRVDRHLARDRRRAQELGHVLSDERGTRHIRLSSPRNAPRASTP